MTTEYTPNVNLYKWKTTDSKQTTIQEMSSNAVKIDTKLNDHTVQLAEIPNQTYITEKAKTTDVNNALALKADKTEVTGIADKGVPFNTLADDITKFIGKKVSFTSGGNYLSVPTANADIVFDVTAVDLTSVVITIDFDFYTDNSIVLKVYNKINTSDSSTSGVGGFSATSSNKTDVVTGKIHHFSASFTHSAADYAYLHAFIWVEMTNTTNPVEFYFKNLVVKVNGVSLDTIVNYTGLHGIGRTFSDVTNLDTQLVPYSKIKGFDVTNNLISRWQGKEVNVIGDSIVKGTGYTPWTSLLSSLLGFATVNNYGVAGSAIEVRGSRTDSLVERYPTMSATANLIVVSAGVNDFNWPQEMNTFGTMDSRDNTSFYGAVHTLATGLINRYPTSYIMFTTPMKTKDSPGALGWYEQNGLGKTLTDYRNAILEVCDYYSIPVLDLYSRGGITPMLTSQKDALLPDGLHPNTAGHERLAKIYANFMIGL